MRPVYSSAIILFTMTRIVDYSFTFGIAETWKILKSPQFTSITTKYCVSGQVTVKVQFSAKNIKLHLDIFNGKNVTRIHMCWMGRAGINLPSTTLGTFFHSVHESYTAVYMDMVTMAMEISTEWKS